MGTIILTRTGTPSSGQSVKTTQNIFFLQVAIIKSSMKWTNFTISDHLSLLSYFFCPFSQTQGNILSEHLYVWAFEGILSRIYMKLYYIYTVRFISQVSFASSPRNPHPSPGPQNAPKNTMMLPTKGVFKFYELWF